MAVADAIGQQQTQFVNATQEDWDYVAELAAHDPSASVRAAVDRALSRHDGQDLDLFFQYHWSFAAVLDDRTFRRLSGDREIMAQHDDALLTGMAEDAEKGERESTGELADVYRSRAIDAWQELEPVAIKATVDWAADQAEASRQTDAWTAVADHARTATSERDWAAVVTLGESRHTSWAALATSAQAQSDSWKAIADHAKASADAAVARGGGNH